MGFYKACTSFGKKHSICQSIVAAIEGQDGRFLKTNRSTGTWNVIPYSRCLELTAAVLERVGKNPRRHLQQQRLVEQDDGTKSGPIEIIDDDEDGYDSNDQGLTNVCTVVVLNTTRKSSTVPNTVKRNLTDEIVIKQCKDDSIITKNKMIDYMVREINKFLETKQGSDAVVSDDEYIAIEKEVRKTHNLKKHVHVSKKLVLRKVEEKQLELRRERAENEVVECENCADSDSESDQSLVF